MKSYRSWTPRQAFLLPPSPTDWLSDDHEVYFVLDLVERLDITAIEEVIQKKDSRGNRPYSPRMMLALLIYGYCRGIRSSRKLERATQEIVPFRVLAGGASPDHTRISEFRRVHLDAFHDLFTQVLLICEGADLVKLGHVSLDGSKVRANASRHKAMSYERMNKKAERYRAEIQQMLDDAERQDSEEDALHGDKRGDELPEKLRDRQARLKRIEQSCRELEAGAAAARARERKARASEKWKEAAEDPDNEQARKRASRAAGKAGAVVRKAKKSALEAGKPEPDLDPEAEAGELPSHEVKSYTNGDPHPTTQRNFTDPDSGIMKGGGDNCFQQSYNAHVAVDEDSQVIVSKGVSNQAADNQYFLPMLDRTEQSLGRYPEKVTADSGFWSPENAAGAEERGVDPYIATSPNKHGPSKALADSEEVEPTARDRMEAKLSTQEAWETYARRKCIVEPVFGQLKAARGFRQFLLRGLTKVRGEWALACLCHNALKLFKAVGVEGLEPAMA